MVGIYFSGTGNTKYCLGKFVDELDENCKIYSIENKQAIEEINNNKTIILAYPIQYSNLPKIVKDFIKNNAYLWKGKNIYIITTMGLFSGDGAGLSTRQLKKYGANIIGGLHLRMPDSVSDVKVLKKTLEQNKAIIKKTENKIHKAVLSYKKGNPTKDGLNILNHMAGLFCQRLYFYNKTKNYTDKLKIDINKCVGCGKCVSLCPMNNLFLKGKSAASKSSCTMCYRCISNCPTQAITLIGKEVIEQCRIERYL